MSLSLELLNGIGSGVGGVSKEAFGAVGVGLAGITSAFKSIKKVPGGEMGIRTSFGRPKMRDGHYVIEGPGLHWVVPFTHGIETQDIRDQPTPLRELFIDRDNPKVQYRVEASFIWRTSPEGDNPGLSRYEVNDIQDVVPNICFSGLRTAMKEINIEQIADENVVETEVIGLCGDLLASYGTELRKLNLQSVAISIGSLLRPVEITQANGNGHSAGALAIATGLAGA